MVCSQADQVQKRLPMEFENLEIDGPKDFEKSQSTPRVLQTPVKDCALLFGEEESSELNNKETLQRMGSLNLGLVDGLQCSA